MTSDAERALAIVPAYNETATVAHVVTSLHKQAPQFDVLVIDDASTDDTGKRAAAAGALVVRHPFNLGIGGAVQTGFIYALEHGYDYMVRWRRRRHEPGELRRLLDAIRVNPDVDMVCGSRFREPQRLPAPVSRRMGIHLFAFTLSKIVGQAVSDPTSGFRLYNRRAITLFARDYPHDYPEVEAVLPPHASKLRMVEVPVQMHPRAGAGPRSPSPARSITW